MTVPTQQQIRQRAYEMYVARGRQDGKALDDWLAAEMELLVESADSEEGRVRRSTKTAMAAAAGSQSHARS